MHQPGLKRPRHCPRPPPPIAHPVDQRHIAPRHMSRQQVRMPRRGLGIRRHHQIGAMVQRPLQQRRHRGVVGNHQRPHRTGPRADRRNVADIEAGVRRRLDKHHPRAGEICRVIGGRGQVGHRYAERAQKFLCQQPGVVIPVRGQHDPVARLQAGHQRARDRRHPGRKCHHRRIFQQRQLRLQLIPGRVRSAAIAVAAKGVVRHMIGRRRNQRRRDRIARCQPRLAVMQQARCQKLIVILHRPTFQTDPATLLRLHASTSAIRPPSCPSSWPKYPNPTVTAREVAAENPPPSGPVSPGQTDPPAATTPPSPPPRR